MSNLLGQLDTQARPPEASDRSASPYSILITGRERHPYIPDL